MREFHQVFRLGKPRDLLNFREDVQPEFRIIDDEFEFVGVTWESAQNYTQFMKLADGANTHKVRSLQTGSADQTTRCGLTVQTCPVKVEGAVKIEASTGGDDRSEAASPQSAPSISQPRPLKRPKVSRKTEGNARPSHCLYFLYLGPLMGADFVMRVSSV